MMKHKEGKCSNCPKVTKLVAGQCQHCYWKHRRSVSESKKREKNHETRKKVYTIPKQTAKRRSENVLYLKKRRIFMEQNTTCQARLTGCSIVATEIHHKKGRTGCLLYDETYFLPVCRSCHDFIGDNGTFARENGFSVSRT